MMHHEQLMRGLGTNLIRLEEQNQNLGGTTGQGIAIGTAVGGTILLSYAAFTVVDSLLKNKVLGFDNRLGTAKMAKRSAMLGAAIGFLPALFYGGVTAAAVMAPGEKQGVRQ